MALRFFALTSMVILFLPWYSMAQWPGGAKSSDTKVKTVSVCDVIFENPIVVCNGVRYCYVTEKVNGICEPRFCEADLCGDKKACLNDNRPATLSCYEKMFKSSDGGSGKGSSSNKNEASGTR